MDLEGAAAAPTLQGRLLSHEGPCQFRQANEKAEARLGSAMSERAAMWGSRATEATAVMNLAVVQGTRGKGLPP